MIEKYVKMKLNIIKYKGKSVQQLLFITLAKLPTGTMAKQNKYRWKDSTVSSLFFLFYLFLSANTKYLILRKVILNILNTLRYHLGEGLVSLVLASLFSKLLLLLSILLLSLLHPFVFSVVLGDTIINKIPTYFHKTIYFK